jgi:phage FluMu protein Com
MASVRDPRSRCKHLNTFSLNQELVGVAHKSGKISVHEVQAGPSDIP